MSNQFSCPCCGYQGLDEPAYEHLHDLPVDVNLLPPYANHFGMPSYEVCDCCGFEFGNDDEPGTSTPLSFQKYLEDWITRGAHWSSPKKRPLDWSLDDQLRRANIPKPI